MPYSRFNCQYDLVFSPLTDANLVNVPLQDAQLWNDLLTRNCQHTVSQLLTCLKMNSLSPRFPVPGSSEIVGLQDDRAVRVVEKLYPRWVEGKVQQFPQVPEPFALIIDGLPKPEFVTIISRGCSYKNSRLTHAPPIFLD